MEREELLEKIHANIILEPGEEVKFAVIIYTTPQNLYVTEVNATPAETISALENAKFMKQVQAFQATLKKGVGMTS
jgi:hypothetical protein